MHQDDFDLTYNPFDDEDNHKNTNELTTRGRQYFGSAFLSSTSSPTLSRRRSSAGESQKSSGSTIRRRHRRSRSDLRLESQHGGESPPPSGHPLKSAALKTATFEDFGVTRPHLSRVVQSSSVDSSLFGGSSDTDDGLPSIREPQTEVLVHEVTSTDSLAGVSLKYGIDLTELRRANQMWANDTIHLRETLLIPLHRASRAHEYVIRTSVAPTHSLESSTSSSDSRTSLDEFSEEQNPSSPGSATNVRRVPVSQLSYFPPPSTRSNLAAGISSPSLVGSSSIYPTSGNKSTQPLSRNNGSGSHSLSSLLNVLPIAASTRDEIVSRLSLDSTSSSYSDRSRPRTSSEENTGHEMNNVHALPINDRRQQTSSHPDSQQTPKISQTVTPTSGQKATPAGGEWRYTAYNRSKPKLSTSPSSYVSQIQNPYIRTSQMEPSPGMKVPLVRSNSDGLNKNRLVDVKHRQYATEEDQRVKPIQPSHINFGTEL